MQKMHITHLRLCCNTTPKHNNMKIYVAGAIMDRFELRALMTKIKNLGHVITHDWTENTQGDEKAALDDIRGVGRADLLIAVMNRDNYDYWGTRHELGAAMLRREQRPPGHFRIWIVCNGGDPRDKHVDDVPNCMRTCFEMCADRYFEDVDDVIPHLQL
jgi:hypothetical protein